MSLKKFPLVSGMRNDQFKTWEISQPFSINISGKVYCRDALLKAKFVVLAEYMYRVFFIDNILKL